MYCNDRSRLDAHHDTRDRPSVPNSTDSCFGDHRSLTNGIGANCGEPGAFHRVYLQALAKDLPELFFQSPEHLPRCAEDEASAVGAHHTHRLSGMCYDVKTSGLYTKTRQ